MVWNKLKQQLESFLSTSLKERVAYLPSGYRYIAEKSNQCFLTVDHKEVFNKKEKSVGITWYETEQEIISDPNITLTVTQKDIETLRATNDKIPEERLQIIARERKKVAYAKNILKAQSNLYKTDFYKISTIFLAGSIESSLDSEDILLNILALIDRRVGKKRLVAMKEQMEGKHPVVRYFYALRLEKKKDA